MVVKLNSKSYGFTLIEIVILLALIAILALTGVSYGMAWIANSNISIAKSNLNIAYRKAVSLALRNPEGITENSASTAASSLVINSGVIEARGSSGNIIWSSILPSGVGISLDAACANKVEINNHGLPINGICVEYTISAKGGSDVNEKLN